MEIFTTDISAKSKEFIRRHIRSVWQLELLLFLKSSTKTMNAAEASRALHMEQRAIEESMKNLSEVGILVGEDDQHFRYSPLSTLADSIDETAKMYNERRTAVINFIYAAPMRSFSDAFKLTGQD